MGLTMAEKILARAAGRARVEPGEIVTVEVGKAVLIDLSFVPTSFLRSEILRVKDPERVVIVFDHIVPARDVQSAEALKIGREVATRLGIRRFHDVGPDQGICHQIIADYGYAVPGTVLVCPDSHTCSAGAFNCAARGVGGPEAVYAACTGQTWFRVAPTIRYLLEGAPRFAVSAKDIFLHIAGTWGDHVNTNVEFTGPYAAAMTLDARRTLTTMCAEISAEFALFEADDKTIAHVRARTSEAFEPVAPDPDARYEDVRTIDVGAIDPMVALPDTVVRNTRPVAEVGDVAIHQAFVGSCANGTLDDLAMAARVVKGRRVAPGVRFIVTPGSQAIYLEALRRGLVRTLTESGAIVTSSTCGACAGLHLGALAAGEVCVTASTRNFKGRMGSPDAKVFIASPATVAASAVRGRIVDPRELLRRKRPARARSASAP
ncbi:MAG: 3-isopropylmalate dehydratase large subunit [Candidatus Rokubacteria bacterium]|nr:3-isopropylmalate dehydratase large subunit [Candidatus Rokubacteria bacterium]